MSIHIKPPDHEWKRCTHTFLRSCMHKNLISVQNRATLTANLTRWIKSLWFKIYCSLCTWCLHSWGNNRYWLATHSNTTQGAAGNMSLLQHGTKKGKRGRVSAVWISGFCLFNINKNPAGLSFQSEPVWVHTWLFDGKRNFPNLFHLLQFLNQINSFTQIKEFIWVIGP